MSDAVVVGQELAAAGEELPVGVAHGLPVDFVLEHDVQDLLNLLAAPLALGRAGADTGVARVIAASALLAIAPGGERGAFCRSS